MEEKEPSFGYSVLAKIIAVTRHRIIITTKQLAKKGKRDQPNCANLR
jgi:hypothetical protein